MFSSSCSSKENDQMTVDEIFFQSELSSGLFFAFEAHVACRKERWKKKELNFLRNKSHEHESGL
jgi:hypothetical protein